ncbi:MAG: hypothetical protein K8U03_25220 [Planctomycetia bacterium]|nr:hypothetical protein [Planctomycetia bacterium]
MKTNTRSIWLSPALVVSVWFTGGGDFARAADAPSGGVAEALKKPMALAFDRNALDATLAIVSEEIGVPIEFIGPDLQAEGITKVQALRLDEKYQPAGQLLRKILKKADPSEKLVYIIKPKTPGGPDMIFITTRAGVEKRKDKLPAEFELPKTELSKTATKPSAKPVPKPKPRKK